MAIKLKLELKGSKIKRVIALPQGQTLLDLHYIIQEMFDFKNDHLWHFNDKNGREWNTGCNPFGEPLDLMDFRKAELLNPNAYCIEDVLEPKRGMNRLLYTYDYGDDWEIAVTRMADTKSDEVVCLETQGTDAMEDIGGVWGLAEFTELLANCTIKSEDEITKDTDFRISEWGYYDPSEREAFLRGPTPDELTYRLKGVVRSAEEKQRARMAAEAERARLNEMARRFANAGRNDPCPCGSGLKYKKCHGR
jgi:hypothetical protein